MSMNFNEAKQLIAEFRRADLNLTPLLYGHTGIGKTELVKEYCAENNIDCLVLHVAQLEPSDFIGLYKVNADYRTETCPPSWLPYRSMTPEELENKETISKMMNGYINPNGGIIFLDEVNRGHEDIRQALYELINDRRLHTYSLPPKYTIVAAANPTQGYETYDFDPALINRFAWIEFIPEKKESIAYLNNKYRTSAIAAWLKGDPDKLVISGDHLSMEDSKQLTPRIAEHAIRIYEQMIEDKCSGKFINKTLSTMMTKRDVDAFIQFQHEAEMLDVKDLLKGDEKTFDKLKEHISNRRLDIMSVVTSRMNQFFDDYTFTGTDEKSRTKEENMWMENLTKYLLMLPKEFVTSFIDACQDKKFFVMKDGKKVRTYNPREKDVIVEQNKCHLLNQWEFTVDMNAKDRRNKPLLKYLGEIKDVMIETNKESSSVLKG